MKDYAAMSDFEINRSVGDIIFGGLWCCRPGSSGNESDSWYYGNADTTFNPLSPLPDYCNNSADAWPILLEHHIAVVPFDGSMPCAWPAGEGLVSKHLTEDENPLRAGMIVFLKMKESKND